MQRKNLTTKFKAALILCVLVLAAAIGYWSGINENSGQFAVARAASDEERYIEEGFFKNYTNWPSSEQGKDPDIIRYVLGLLYNNIPGASPHNFVDINGDGLVDILYSTGVKMGEFINNGANGMNAVYLCVVGDYPRRFYGDCANVK